MKVLRIASEFAEKVKELNGILVVCLFGSVVRGTTTRNNTKKLDQNTRSKLNRALYGGVSTASYKNKKYLTKYHGIAEVLGIKKLAPSVLLCDRERANAVTKTLEQFKAEYHELAVWVY
ncbi:MAG TPA: hypothetical protein EYP22_03170 [Methanosarcinales archaeon]|nr:hypothetical protein [Methanosarcinales archaeon]